MKVETSVSGIYVDQETGEPVVVLKEVDGGRSLPIWISSNEMLAMAIELAEGDCRPPRPLSHDLIGNVVQELDAKILESVVCSLEDSIYKARIVLESETGYLELDCRPSDAIIMSLKSGGPIFVASQVFEDRIHLTKADGNNPEDVWDRLQEVRPDDLDGQNL